MPYSVFKPTADVVKFLKSPHACRPPTILFSYPSYVNAKHPIEVTADDETLKVYDRRAQIEVLFFSFLNSDRTHVYNAVVNTMKNGGFEMIEKGDDFNLIWTGYTTVLDILPLNKYQRVNHFPNSIALGRKDLFWNHLHIFKKKYPIAFNVTPHSWLLPFDYKEFENVRKMTQKADKFFILKPTASSCGRGIRVVHGS